MSVVEKQSTPRAMPERYRAGIESLLGAVLNGEGDSPPGLRQAVMRRAAQLSGQTSDPPSDLPSDLVPYVDKVALHAYRTVDRDIQELRDAGYSEDAIFETTVSAALGAGLTRLELGLAALHGEE